MGQSPPNRTTEAAPDDRESYRRFRAIAFSMVAEEQTPIASEQSWFARIWGQMSPRTTQKPRTLADYISLIAHLHEPQNLRYAPAALAGISFLKHGDLELAQSVFEEIRERVIKPSPLFYLMRGSLIFVVVLMLIVLLAFAISLKPDGNLSMSTDVIKIMAGFAAGCMGGFTSIMHRLDHFVSFVDRPRDYLSWTGFALPVVGGTLGAFSSMILLSNILNIALGQAGDTRSANVVLYVLIGFIAGYSERFSKSLVKLAEEHLGGRSMSS